MNVLIVPDVHGRTFWRKAKKLVKQYQEIIFLGDYLDPYKQEGITPEEALKEFKEIIEFKKKYPKKVTLLLGNHDLHYWSPDFVPSTRKNVFEANKYQELYKENKDLFTCFKTIESFGYTWLFSHAGINPEWLKHNKLSLEELLKMSLDELLDNKGESWGSILEQVNFYRGGVHAHGSPVWIDIREALETNMVIADKVIQIVGHNQVNGIVKCEGIYFTDCRKLISLDTETREVTYA